MASWKHWWTFTRPHTIIGSLLSITALYLIAAAEAVPAGQPGAWWALVKTHAGVYAITLFSALTCNVFITGLNQWQDIAVDKINKPWLPLAAGTIPLPTAKVVVIGCLVLSLASAAWIGMPFLLLMLLINGIGAAYSLPPLKLKRHHLPAAMAIVAVRGLLVNLGMAAHFTLYMQGTWHVPMGVWPLALFVVGFSLGIAWFKDIPDTEGDEQFDFRTLAVSMSRKTALWLGVAVVSLSYLLVAAAPFVMEMKVHAAFFSLSHLGLCLLFIYQASRLQLNQQHLAFLPVFLGLVFCGIPALPSCLPDGGLMTKKTASMNEAAMKGYLFMSVYTFTSQLWVSGS